MVQNAMQATSRGKAALAWRTPSSIIVAIQKDGLTMLQDQRTVQKVFQLDQNITMATAGINADAFVLAEEARQECQDYRLDYDDDPPVDHIAKYIAGV